VNGSFRVAREHSGEMLGVLRQLILQAQGLRELIGGDRAIGIERKGLASGAFSFCPSSICKS
jgi:hypothetical protein